MKIFLFLLEVWLHTFASLATVEPPFKQPLYKKAFDIINEILRPCIHIWTFMSISRDLIIGNIFCQTLGVLFNRGYRVHCLTLLGAQYFSRLWRCFLRSRCLCVKYPRLMSNWSWFSSLLLWLPVTWNFPKYTYDHDRRFKLLILLPLSPW